MYVVPPPLLHISSKAYRWDTGALRVRDRGGGWGIGGERGGGRDRNQPLLTASILLLPNWKSIGQII